MITADRHIAIVLAAGGSTRLGRAKQLLTSGFETLVHRAVRLARETYPTRVLVVVGARQRDVMDAIEDLKCDVLINPAWPQGLWSSLRCASHALGLYSGPVLLMGCDQPALTLSHLKQLIQAAASSERGYAATEMDGHLGSPAVVPGNVLSYIEHLRGDHGLTTRLNELPQGHVTRLPALDLQYDIDDEADVRLAIQRGWLDSEVIDLSGGFRRLGTDGRTLS
jgi:molybdenum cofactor cytidylyltransferase